MPERGSTMPSPARRESPHRAKMNSCLPLRPFVRRKAAPKTHRSSAAIDTQIERTQLIRIRSALFLVNPFQRSRRGAALARYPFLQDRQCFVIRSEESRGSGRRGWTSACDSRFP